VKVRTAIRKTVKWGGAVAVVLLVALWVSSKWWWVQLTPSGTTQITSSGGRLFVEVRTSNSSNRWQVGLISQVEQTAVAFSWDFWPISDRQSTGRFIPVWFPTALVLIPTALAWWLDRRASRRSRIGLCPACSYDRLGLAAGAVCPECGAAPTAPVMAGVAAKG